MPSLVHHLFLEAAYLDRARILWNLNCEPMLWFWCTGAIFLENRFLVNFLIEFCFHHFTTDSDSWSISEPGHIDILFRYERRKWYINRGTNGRRVISWWWYCGRIDTKSYQFSAYNVARRSIRKVRGKLMFFRMTQKCDPMQSVTEREVRGSLKYFKWFLSQRE